MLHVSALTLVNELLALHRYDPVTTFDGTDGTIGLQFINFAIDDILNDNEWDFAKKHDGILYTAARAEGYAGTDVTTDTLDTVGGDVALDLASDPLVTVEPASVDEPYFCPWFYLYGDSTIEDASYKAFDSTNLLSAHNIKLDQREAIIDGVPLQNTGTGWRGGNHTIAGQTLQWTGFAHEYTLPTYVRDVLSVRHQGGDVAFVAINDSIATQTLVANPEQNFGDVPDTVWAGGVTTRSVSNSWLASNPLPRLVIYPTPISVYKLDYSYLYRFPQLAATTDSIDITSTAKGKLVRHAYALSNLSKLGNDPEMAKTGLQLSTRDVARAKRQEMASNERYSIRPYGEGLDPKPTRRWASQTVPSP